MQICGYDMQLLFYNIISNATDAILQNNKKGNIWVLFDYKVDHVLINISNDSEISDEVLNLIKSRKPFSKLVWQILQALKEKGLEYFLVIVPKHYFEKLGTIKFYQVMFSIPSDVEGYLEYRYGKDWKTPKKDWKWWNEDGAVSKKRRLD